MNPRVKNLKPSTSALARIMDFEGGRGSDGRYHPYRDGGGTWTIGIGHTAGVNADSRPLTASEARALFGRDLERVYLPAVRAHLLAYGIKRLSQSRFDALVDMAFNCGGGILDVTHTIGAALKHRDWPGVSVSFLLYDHDRTGRRERGLTVRREWDQAQWDRNR